MSVSNNFTVLRLALALLVLLGHFKLLSGTASPPHVFAFADFAVQAFFVVSGYLVSVSWQQCPIGRSYAIKRICRIYPLYAVVVLVQAGLMAAVAPGQGGGVLPYLTANLAFANFLQPDIAGLFQALPVRGVNPSLWTLKIEVVFYALVPPMLMFVRRFGPWPLVAVFVVSTAYFELLRSGSPELAKQLPGQLRFFAIGMVMATYGRRPALPHWAVAALFVPVIGLCIWRHQLVPQALQPLVVAAFVYLAVFQLPALNLRADLSYGVYLLHGPVIQFALLFGWFRDSLAGLAAVTVLVLVLAWAGRRWVELPAIALGQRLARRWERPLATAFVAKEQPS